MKQILKAKCRSHDFPPIKYIALRVNRMTSKAKTQLSPRQSGFGCSTSQVGRKARAAIQNTHLAAGQDAASVGGRLSQRGKKRYAQSNGPTHPKLYWGSAVQ